MTTPMKQRVASVNQALQLVFSTVHPTFDGGRKFHPITALLRQIYELCPVNAVEMRHSVGRRAGNCEVQVTTLRHPKLHSLLRSSSCRMYMGTRLWTGANSSETKH
ncbi:uncharacterized protein PV09_08694 [Verruconis gallopava]|uniref:Uncharacterized protein n=1 Tax=Verruconis gallopava TaxID=253628 RepID=A0A0D2A006_9PEZI|nr:uncharacterized protein PV09_08694 [Verruconis gallopava]KIV99629.1 hypothetical protein PV09_08694 [Verruconis gallopava]